MVAVSETSSDARGSVTAVGGSEVVKAASEKSARYLIVVGCIGKMRHSGFTSWLYGLDVDPSLLS